jgi:hypothetical protein
LEQSVLWFWNVEKTWTDDSLRIQITLQHW